jgi:thiosulfate/3-mercaptopyruvate sulfurtransferase
MLPSAAAFALACGELGLERDDDVVVYNSEGALSAARCWWTFKCFGERMSVRVTLLLVDLQMLW